MTVTSRNHFLTLYLKFWAHKSAEFFHSSWSSKLHFAFPLMTIPSPLSASHSLSSMTDSNYAGWPQKKQISVLPEDFRAVLGYQSKEGGKGHLQLPFWQEEKEIPPFFQTWVPLVSEAKLPKIGSVTPKQQQTKQKNRKQSLLLVGGGKNHLLLFIFTYYFCLFNFFFHFYFSSIYTKGTSAWRRSISK